MILHALAYIDAGSGSLIMQAVIATIVAVPFFFRQQIGRVVRAVRADRSGRSREAAAERAGSAWREPRR